MNDDHDEYTKKFELYCDLARKKFSTLDYISIGKLQATLQIPYHLARRILDFLIQEQFCSPQYGAFPCRVFHFTTN